jgi:lipopolysaccharide cholinephosphotransferase
MVFMGHSRKAPRKAHIWTSITYVHPAKVFEGDAKFLSFEGELFPAPPDYEEYLRNAYGDYMQLPPEEKRTSNHGDMIIDLEHSWERYNQKS